MSGGGGGGMKHFKRSRSRKDSKQAASRGWWECLGCDKRAYRSRAAAREKADELEPGGRAGVYLCPVTRYGYHWGHTPGIVADGVMSGRRLADIGGKNLQDWVYAARREAQTLHETIGDLGRLWFDPEGGDTTVMCGTCVDARLAPVAADFTDPWTAAAWWAEHVESCDARQEATG